MIDAFLQGLKDLGYVEGKNIRMEYRFTDRKPERLPEVAAELVALKVDVIVTESGTAAIHAKKATQSIPIVMGGSGNPVGQGLVASLERPGGNVTGLTDWAPDMVRNRLQVLGEALPSLARVGVLWPGPGNPVMEREWAETAAAARLLGLQIHPLVVQGAADLPAAFADATRQKLQAVVIFALPNLIATAGSQIAELATANRLPIVSHIPRYPMGGGLMSYGANPLTFSRQAASYVDRILKGASPAELPVEGPKKVWMVINLKAAKAIDLTIPPSLLAKADEVIQ
jgi:putative ABC transport system substrate-binding protein